MIWRVILSAALTVILLPSLYATPNSILAVVNDEIITSKQIDDLVKMWQANNAEQRAPSTPTILQLINNQIDLILIKQQAKKYNIDIPPEALKQQLEAFAQRNRITYEQLSQREEFPSIVEQIKTEFIIYNLRRTVTDDVTQTDTQSLQQYYQQQLLQAYRYHLYNIMTEDKKLATKLQVILETDSGLFQKLAKQYSLAANAQKGGDIGILPYQQVPVLYRQVLPELEIGEVSPIITQNDRYHLVYLADKQLPQQDLVEQVRFKHIFIPDTGATQRQLALTPSEQIVDIYDQLISASATFAELAKVYSKGQYARKGGQTPWVSVDTLGETMTKTLLPLKKSEISRPFQSRYGWHIVQKINERKINKALLVAQQNLLNERRSQAFSDWLAALKKQSDITIYEQKIQ